jgi:hypothetical protein
MESESLPPQLAELERRLRRRDSIAPSTNFKNRVVAAAEMARRAPSSPLGWGSLQWSAAAAAILVLLNVSMIAASRNAVSVSDHDHVTIAKYLQMLHEVEAQQNRDFK